jgi:protein O-GlcNAcase/histone acetyltransferase
MTGAEPPFLAGVIEGFYGPPWSPTERLELLDWMAAWGLNTYAYAPKDDLKHRALWREPYSEAEARTLADLIRAADQRQIQFIYALSPGLDIRYSDETERDLLRRRFDQLLALGCRQFALLFDDIPDALNAADRERFGSFAAAQCHVANALFGWTRERCPQARFFFCPTAYCERMAAAQLGGPHYLATVGSQLAPEIDVFWTGPEIISREISAAHVRTWQPVLRRKPVIWDNLHANDYDGRRFFCGPYAGRPLELRAEVTGLLANPNTEFPLNFVPLRTLAAFTRLPLTAEWDPRRAYLSAMGEWLPHFATLGPPLPLEDLIVFGDCYYLPHEEGPEAEAFYQSTRALLAQDPAGWGEAAAAWRRQAARLLRFCARLTELRRRPLFYALFRRAWELREELALLDYYVEFKSRPGQAAAPCRSDFHQPGVFRGGLVARLQQLLHLAPDGAWSPGP